MLKSKKIFSYILIIQLAYFLSCQSEKKENSSENSDSTSVDIPQNNTNFIFHELKMDETYTSPTGLKVTLTQEGTGEYAKKGDKVTVHYVGKFSNGKEFDNSYKSKQPFTFMLGTGQVIAGWDEGIMLLKKGAKASMEIPPQLAYGPQGYDIIPPNATLFYDVELVGIQEKQ